VVKSSLRIALDKMNPALSRANQQIVHDDILDELTCYIERTIQVLWLNFKIGMFSRDHSLTPSSIMFRLQRQAKDHFKL